MLRFSIVKGKCISFGLFIILMIASVLGLTSCNQYSTVSKAPNVILILTDDQGYGDLSCHGNKYLNTPNIDRLYEESVRFTDFHVDPTCAPTRAALMTGKYSHHAGVWHTVSGGNHLRATEVTMADIFKEAGYQTALFGKWHLGSNYPYRPMDRGFDEWLGQGDGGTGTTDDWFDNDRVNDYYWHNGEREKVDGYAPDVFYNAAIDFITENKENEKPFFIYLPTYIPHGPHSVPDETWAKNNNPDVKESVSYFFAGIKRVDQNIGRLRNELEQSGLSDNTIVIFMSDNGGTDGVRLYNAGMRGRKAQVYEGGHRVPFFVHWPNGNLKQGKDVTDLTAHIDLLPTLVEMCGLSSDYRNTAYDGRSFMKQLYDPELELSSRTLFVENQRTFKPVPWQETAGMTGDWRLVDNKELYNIKVDPAQKNNVIANNSEIANQIRLAYEKYWSLVTPGDRDEPQFVLGHAEDPETYLTSSDWYLPNVPWNHAQIANGSPIDGSWNISVSKKGIYRFELRRWPREAKATIQGIPNFKEKIIDAWTSNGPVEKLIYGDNMIALPVESMRLEVAEMVETKPVGIDDDHIAFEVSLGKGDTKVIGTMLDEDGNVIAGAYYVYISLLSN
ncbi:MAG: arylsulfatase [Reichenbachiella sp.]